MKFLIFQSEIPYFIVHLYAQDHSSRPRPRPHRRTCQDNNNKHAKTKTKTSKSCLGSPRDYHHCLKPVQHPLRNVSYGQVKISLSFTYWRTRGCVVVVYMSCRCCRWGIIIRTCYSPDPPANNSGFRYSPDDASVYLQRTRPGPGSLIAINIQCVVFLSHPNPCFALGSRLDRLLDERSVVPALRGYRPLVSPTPSLGK